MMYSQIMRRWLVGVVVIQACGGGGVEARKPCHRSYFKTELVHAACERGGQEEARLAMTAFAKRNNVPSCLKCHLTMSPYFDLRPEGFQNYLNFGGHPYVAPPPTSPSPSLVPVAPPPIPPPPPPPERPANQNADPEVRPPK